MVDFKVTKVSSLIGKGGYGSVYVVEGEYGLKNILIAIKIMNPKKNKNGVVLHNAQNKFNFLKYRAVNIPTLGSFRSVENNENIAVMILMSNNSQYCFSSNNVSNDRTIFRKKLKSGEINIDKIERKKQIGRYL